MNLTYESEKILKSTGLFSNNTDVTIYLLMKMISESAVPMGAWVLNEQLLNNGVKSSVATVGRYLKMLDYRNHTIRKGFEGRILTPEGIEALNELDALIDRALMQNKFSHSIRVNEYRDLLDLIHARKALESEAARLAAQNATDEELEELLVVLRLHRKYVEENQDPTEQALAFHSTIAKISHNKFIAALLNMLIFEEKKIEAKFEKLVTRERGRVYIQEHEKITNAIIERDAEYAAKLMDSHISELYQAIGKQAHDTL
jgi:hypothetical protein